ncbi:YdbC family protein [Alkalibacterium iburiense]|uniref:YdbC family protein n=1 Tax=Alkalibacterium iburiense TaxID=290589 RepID=A0ABN0WZW1_9LACT
MSDFSFEVLEHITVLSESPKGWKKELNLVSWNNQAPKFDIRDWSPDHKKMGKGVTFSNDEMLTLKKTLESIDLNMMNE